MLAAPGMVFCQDFPSKPIRIVTSQPGGGNDFVARVIAQGFGDSLGQRMLVDNRGLIAAEVVAKAAPDGYTLLLYGDPFWLAPFLRDGVPYDPVKDFSPVSLAVSVANILVIHPSLPVKTVKDLIALAKARPGELDYASGITGSTTHLASELFKYLANVSIVRIAYKGTGAAFVGLFSGQVQVMFPTLPAAVPHLKSSRLRALAITTPQPSVLLPELPTIAATLPGYEAVAKTGIFAPARTPDPVVNWLSREFVRVLNQPDVRRKFADVGVEADPGPPAELAAAMRSEMTRMGKLIKAADIREK